MVNLLITAIEIYAAIIIVSIIHEIGHVGKIQIRYKFPFPQMQANNARFRYGGLIVNTITGLAILYFKPNTEFLQIIGLVSAVYVILYLILGSIIPDKTGKTVDDVPNDNIVLNFAIAGLLILIFREYYIEIIKRLIGA